MSQNENKTESEVQSVVLPNCPHCGHVADYLYETYAAWLTNNKYTPLDYDEVLGDITDKSRDGQVPRFGHSYYFKDGKYRYFTPEHDDLDLVCGYCGKSVADNSPIFDLWMENSE